MSTEEHLNSTFLTILILLMLHGEEISQGHKKLAKTHLSGCEDCGRRLVELLRVAGEATGTPLIISARGGATLTSLDADADMREIFAECIKRYA